MRRRTVTFTVLLAFGAYVSFSLVTGVLVCEGALRPQRRPLSPAAEIESEQRARDSHADFKAVSVPASDGVVLRAWLIRPQTDNQQAVILLHGMSNNRTGMNGYAEIFLRHHYYCLDAR